MQSNAAAPSEVLFYTLLIGWESRKTVYFRSELVVVAEPPWCKTSRKERIHNFWEKSHL